LRVIEGLHITAVIKHYLGKWCCKVLAIQSEGAASFRLARLQSENGAAIGGELYASHGQLAAILKSIHNLLSITALYAHTGNIIQINGVTAGNRGSVDHSDLVVSSSRRCSFADQDSGFL